MMSHNQGKIAMFNQYQPVRPRIHPETGLIMRYATMPKKWRRNHFHVCSLPSMISQCRLYRAVCKGEVSTQVLISELYEWCFFDKIDTVSKTQMGYNVMQSLIYEPRKMVNRKSVGKPVMTYVFRHTEDLKYGLEWQICVWLRRFLNEQSAPEDAISTQEEMAEELDFLGNSDNIEYLDVYESRFMNFIMEEPDLRTLTATMEEQLPEVEAAPRFVRGPKPRDLSKL